jgi:hypothetical protein
MVVERNNGLILKNERANVLSFLNCVVLGKGENPKLC